MHQAIDPIERMTRLVRTTARAVASLAACVMLAGTTLAQVAAAPPPTAESTRLGMVTALTGPAKSLGLNMRAGVLAAFEEANRAGGINGRTLELRCADDGYEPARTGPTLRAMISNDAVIGIIGDVGTPTGVVAMPICREMQVPFVAPFSGAMPLRPTPPDPMVFHFRAS
jgi:branched-chain amino acid transport system substrate-binding protein